LHDSTWQQQPEPDVSEHPLRIFVLMTHSMQIL